MHLCGAAGQRVILLPGTVNRGTHGGASGNKATEFICTSRFVFHRNIIYAHQHWINVHYEVISVFMKGHESCWYSPSAFKVLLMQIYLFILNKQSKLPGYHAGVTGTDKTHCKSHCAGLTTTNTLQHQLQPSTCVRRINRKLFGDF